MNRPNQGSTDQTYTLTLSHVWKGKEYFFLPIMGILLLHFTFDIKEVEMKMDQRLTMITLGVSDLENSKRFYNEVFGWTPTKDSNENIVFYKANGMLLSLYERQALVDDAMISTEGERFRSFSMAYNTRNKEEVDALMAMFNAAGTTILKEAQDVFWGGYSGYIQDPDGFIWEIAYNPHMLLDVYGSVK